MVVVKVDGYGYGVVVVVWLVVDVGVVWLGVIDVVEGVVFCDVGFEVLILIWFNLVGVDVMMVVYVWIDVVVGLVDELC